MAPGRRKGRATAAAAAASQLQWKIGDLVLAKVKGFPPWPAVISDPQKWGYSSDRRKLFVYFFGTKQIAFCNHADVEAFTEEKRRLLLGKRQGKGMDFIRAVDEIIENFERLTKHMVNDELCSGDDIESHLYNVEDTGANRCKDSQKESFSTSNGASETSFSQRSNDSDSSEEIPTTLMEDDTAQNKVMTPGYQSCQVSIVDRLRNIPLASNALARRSRYLSHSSCTQKRTLSHQRSRSKTGINSCKFQKNEGRVEDENNGNLLSEEMTDDCSLSDNIEKRKCLDVHDNSSEVSNLAGNNQFEDTATEVEWGAYSPKERCVMELNCNGESKVKNSGKDHAVDRGFEAQRNFSVLKKKRKPSKKHSDQEAEKARCARSESSSCHPISSDSWHNPKDRPIQKDGDEHLPLVKRARVRMGNIPEEKKINYLVGMVGKSENDILPCVRNLSSSSDGTCGPHETSRSGFDGSLPTDDKTSTVGHVTGMHWKERNCRSRGNAIDMEAALPPSKRLNRALEAMSVNATKSNDGPLEASTFISSCSSAQVSNADTCCILLDGKCNSLRKSDGVSSLDMNPKPSSRNSPIVNACVEPSTEAKMEDISRESCLTFQCMNYEAKDKDIKYSEELPNLTVTTGLNDRNHLPSFSLVIGESKEAVSHPIVDDSMDDTVVDSAALNATESLVAHCDDKHGIDLLELAVESHFNTSSDGSGFSSDSNSTKNLIVASQAEGSFSQAGYPPENSHAKTVIDEHFSDKLSPKNSTVSHTDLVEETAGNLHSGEKSPNSIQQVNESAQLMGFTKMQSDNSSDQNEKILHRSSTLDEATTARKSFESLVSTLSRTKESIGRATRVALECMKHGIAGEVVQILVHNLEMTVNLSRKLDLFFLVDSITQRSRLHKGAAGDSYPDLFQPVLSRLLLAAAPPGNNECDNHRQCLKVLKLWHDRRILPKSVVRSHIQELESTSEASFPPRAERALSDPIREMEGMLVDEYGSNASFQIPSASKSHWVEGEGEGEEEGSAGAEKSFETITPVHDSKTSKKAQTRPDSFSDKHTLILEDVDGELEMEDVSPQCPNGEIFPYEPGRPPLPADKPPSPPPLPSSPPPGVPLCRPVLSLIPPSAAAPPNHDDDLASHSFPVRNSVQYSLSSRGPCVSNMDLRLANGGPQIQLSSSPCHYQRSYGYPLGGHPSVCGRNDAPPMRNSKGYHLQPPPPSSMSKLPHDHAEKHNPPRYWRERNHSSPYHRRLQFPNETQGSSHSYSNGYSRRPVHSEMSERCSRFSPTARSGPKFPAKAEGSPSVLPHCGPRAQVSSVRNGWSNAPRGSSYRFPVTASRPPLENKVSQVAGASDYWRPR